MILLRHRHTVIALVGSMFVILAVVSAQGQSGAVDGDQGKPAATTATGDPADGESSDAIELHVKEADLSAVLKLLADQHKLNIVAGKDVTGKVTADLYGVTVDQALAAVLEMNGYAYRRDGNFVYVYTKQQLADYQISQAKIETRTFRLRYINVTDAQALLKPVLSKKAIVAASAPAGKGIPSGGEDVEGDSYTGPDVLVISDYTENLDGVAKLLKEIDLRPKQVLIEATILQVTLDDDASMGVDFNILAGIDFREISVGNFPLANPNSVVGAATTTGATGNIPWGRAGTTGFATPGTGFQMGIITNDISVFVQALETVEDVNILSNPKVLALNKHRAEVIVGERLGYRTTTTTATSEVENIEFLDTGTSLRFRPFICDDGYIRMEIHPEVSTGNISGLGLPSERTTEVTCNIMIRDGHTIVIGGLFDENSQIDKAQVPGLGNLPVIGALFRNDHQSTLRREIIILLTPHIIDDSEAKAEGEEILEYIDRTVTTLRSRFPLYTREKLTQLHLTEAEKYYNRYLATRSDSDRGKALWYLKLTRHVAPNNREVYRLLDSLEAEKSQRQPRLNTESILWRRMRDEGILAEMPALPPREPRGWSEKTDKTDEGGQ
jgi:type IV pilus assembly protein PilQ